ncbi:hypothetical protein DJ010_06040 [Nocardioides silvaticus]|uniref:DUF3071 domain-containing protein n=1 Tax=Nocardioides silvaticus TaxID=2201891 RepID=A0A316TGY5_9ACTN|nr:septation protein SepH [Nocardioides silvaticus]PWN03650.1 hypothetical protein DJ010_06040 [Nocardioides silvaticus]
MAHLDLAGVSADGRRLLLVSQQGEEFTLEINPALRAALRGETTRIGQLEIQMTSTLRPREIQARIRAGESPEAVAGAGQTTVEAIMPYVGPVLAEREHVAERAQKSSVRRPAGDPGAGSRVLGAAVSAHLSTVGAKADDVEWDAFRRDDGRWELAGTYDTSERSGTARFTYDVPGNYVVADDDDARWLVGDLVTGSVETPPDDLEQARQRRLAAVSSDDLPLGDDALDLVTGEAAVPGEAAYDEAPPAPPTYDDPLRDTSADVEQEPAAVNAPPVDPSKHRRPVAKKRGRASVPSWDEIMFGGSSE